VLQKRYCPIKYIIIIQIRASKRLLTFFHKGLFYSPDRDSIDTPFLNSLHCRFTLAWPTACREYHAACFVRRALRTGLMPNHSPSRTVQALEWAILFGWILWLLRAVVGWLLRPAQPLLHGLQVQPAPVGARRRQTPAPSAPKAIALRRDPWCGTHVSPEISFTLEHAGQIEHFCSDECRHFFRQSQRRAESA
jgi:YHS domain-containing protein